MAEYNPEQPALTLYGTIQANAVGKDKYGISDETGLGPNGADKYISYDIIISNISAQPVGDASVRDSSGLLVGGSYDGIDIKVGDWVSDVEGLRTFKITAISEKTNSYISCSVEDVGMNVARTRADRVNSYSSGQAVVVFETSDNNQPLLAPNQFGNLGDARAVDGIQTYFNVYEPFQRFTLYPDITGSVSIGDLVTITGSVGGSPVTPYRLIPAEEGDTVIGVVSDIYGGNNVNVRPYNKIITNFSAPELLTSGSIGSTWYLSGSGAYTTSSDLGGDPKFFQLSLPIKGAVTGSIDGTDFDETQYNLVINNVEVIAQNAGGSTLTLSQIVSAVNTYENQTYVSASIYQTGGGNATITTGDSGASLADPAFLGMYLDLNPGSPGSYPSAPGEFTITAGATSFNVKPTTADVSQYTYPAASIDQIKLDIEAAALSAGVSITVTKNSATSLTIEETTGANLTLTQVAQDAFG